MGRAVPLFDHFRGFQTDPPLDQMPRGVARKALDWNPRPNFAMAEARGYWSWYTGQVSSANAWRWLTYCPFVSGGAKIVLSLAATDTKYVSTLDGATTGTAVPGGALPFPPTSQPVFHLTSAGGLLIYCSSGTLGIPRKWDGTASHADLGGSPPQAFLAASWGDYLILANTAANPNRMFFSAVGNPDSWPANNSIDFPERIKAIVPRGNNIFVFGEQYVHLLVGDTPPPGGNMTLRKNLYPHGVGNGYGGVTGQEAVATYKDFVIWANKEGIFKSDGGQPVDLAQLGGISSYWLYLMGPLVSPSDKRLSVGVYRNFLFVTLFATASGDATTTLVYDLEENVWWEWSNINATTFCSIPKFTGTFGDAAPDLLWIDAHTGSPNDKIVGVRPCFLSTDVSGAAQDANGFGGPAPILSTGAIRVGGFVKKRVRRGYLSFVQRASMNVEIDVTWDFVPSPDADPTSIQLNEGTQSIFSATTTASHRISRRVFRIDRLVEMIQVKISSFGAGTGLRIMAIEAEVSDYDDTRAGDPGV